MQGRLLSDQLLSKTCSWKYVRRNAVKLASLHLSTTEGNTDSPTTSHGRMADRLVGQDSSVMNESTTFLDCCSILSAVFVSRRSTVWLEYHLRHMKQNGLWFMAGHMKQNGLWFMAGHIKQLEWALIYGGAYEAVRIGFDLWRGIWNS